MPSTHASLDAAATERKVRLAKLKSLKRKQASPPPTEQSSDSQITDQLPLPPANPPSSITQHLSGRNYDPETRGPKLGFEHPPTATSTTTTLETRAQIIATEANEAAAREEQEEKAIDLFKLQPKRPNWDLKRDLAKRRERLDVATENSIARLVRERIEGGKRREVQVAGKAGVGEIGRERGEADGEGEGEVLGLGGVELVEGVRVREREEKEEERREREVDAEED